MKTKPIILIQKHHPDHDGILMPKMDGDVGYDLVCSEDFILPPHGSASTAFIIPAGVNIKSPEGFFCQIVGRSSAARRGIGVQTALIDNGYVGPMFACSWNMTNEPILIKKGERIAQVVFFPMYIFPIKVVDKLPDTTRKDAGFGSTGR